MTDASHLPLAISHAQTIDAYKWLIALCWANAVSQSWHTNLPIDTLSTKDCSNTTFMIEDWFSGGLFSFCLNYQLHLKKWLLSFTPWLPLLTAYNSILGNARATYLWNHSHTHLVYFEFPQHSGVFLLLNRTLQDLGPTTMLSRSGSGNGSSFSNSNCRNMIAQIVLTCSNNIMLCRCQDKDVELITRQAHELDILYIVHLAYKDHLYAGKDPDLPFFPFTQKRNLLRNLKILDVLLLMSFLLDFTMSKFAYRFICFSQPVSLEDTMRERIKVLAYLKICKISSHASMSASSESYIAEWLDLVLFSRRQIPAWKFQNHIWFKRPRYNRLKTFKVAASYLSSCLKVESLRNICMISWLFWTGETQKAFRQIS